jgi:hypothetical protein
MTTATLNEFSEAVYAHSLALLMWADVAVGGEGDKAAIDALEQASARHKAAREQFEAEMNWVDLASQ